jgi:hypothetical protein
MALMEKEEIPNTEPKYLHFLAVWSKSDTFPIFFFKEERKNSNLDRKSTTV